MKFIMEDSYNVSNKLTSEIVAAYSQCPLKAFFLLQEDSIKPQHEYVTEIDKQAKKQLQAFLAKLVVDHDVHITREAGISQFTDVSASAILYNDDYIVDVDALIRKPNTSQIKVFAQ